MKTKTTKISLPTALLDRIDEHLERLGETVHTMDEAELAKGYNHNCTGPGCTLRATVKVGDLPFCTRCGQRKSRELSAFYAKKAKAMVTQFAPLTDRDLNKLIAAACAERERRHRTERARK